MRKWIQCKEKLPPDSPDDFGVEYEIKYISESGKVKIAETEWLWDRTWNWTLPVIAWREYIPIVNISKHKKGVYDYEI